MADELKPEVLRKTQETLGKFIKKPVLTEKLLMKPPFRFLHDICTAAMRETGFFENVLNPTDSKADNIKDKEGKIAFLQKVITAVEESNGIKLAIKPSKVVAGHEPLRTNEFLQALAKALEMQTVQNTNATKPKSDPKRQVDSKSKTKPSTKRSEKDESGLKKKNSSTKISKTDRTIADKHSEVPKARTNPEKTSPPKPEKDQKSQISLPKDQENNANKQNNEVDDGEKESKRRERNKLKSSQASSNDIIEISSDKTIEKQDSFPENVQKLELVETEVKRLVSAKPGHRKQLTVSEVTESTVATEPNLANEYGQEETVKSDTPVNKIQADTPTKRPESNYIRLTKQNSNASSIPPGYSIKDPDMADDSSPISRPLTSIRPKTGRPASARPAAPRIRDRGEIQIQEDVVKQSMGNVQIITDKKEGNEPDEDENVVVVEPESELITDELSRKDQLDSNHDENLADGEYGLLVEQILETQKELDQSRMQIIDNKTPGKTEIEWKSSRNREATEREVKKLRLCIQTLTRSANPLGKLLNFLQEDVDIMQKELMKWKDMNANLDVQIDQERSLTEQSVEPLKVHLKELQQNIDQQLEQMTVVKGNILRNDEKIYKLLTDIK